MTRKNKAMKRVIAASAAVAILGGATTLAAFTDRERVFSNQLSAGDANSNFDLIVPEADATKNGVPVAAGEAGVVAWDGSDESDTNQAGLIRLNVTDLVPGDKWTYTLSPENVGQFDARYAMEAALTNTAATLADLKAADEGDSSDFGGLGSEFTIGGVDYVVDAAGVVHEDDVEGPVVDPATVQLDKLGLVVEVKQGATVIASNAASTGAIELFGFGDKAAGADAGDRDLAAGAVEPLVVEITYPAGADQMTYGAAATLDMTFLAEQTRNNP